MGSPTVSTTKPNAMEKKWSLGFLKSIFNKKKEEKCKCKKKYHVEEKKTKQEVIKSNFGDQINQSSNTVATILENFNKLNLDESKTTKQEKVIDDDELDNFTIKVINEESRNERIYSHSSEDSGFSESKEVENTDKTEKAIKLENNEEIDDLAVDLEKLELEDDKKNKKKVQEVRITRGPVRDKVSTYSVDPYPAQEKDHYRQISQINKHTLTGGQVIVNQSQIPDPFSEISIALENVQQKSQYLQNDSENYLKDLMELINDDINRQGMQIPVLTPKYECQEQMPTNTDYGNENTSSQSTYTNNNDEKSVEHNDLIKLLGANFQIPPEPNGVEEFNVVMMDVEKQHKSQCNDGFLNSGYTYPTPPRSDTNPVYTYLTPPRSDAVPSPMSASPASFYPSNSDYTLSPERSPVYNSDYEKYQDIHHSEEEKDSIDKKTRERTASLSSMTMKQFKDMQKEIVHNFSKKDCCQDNRKSCNEIFKEHFQKLSMPVRMHLGVEFSRLDLKEAHGVLKPILRNLAKSSEKEDIQYALFNLVCERILAHKPTLFIGDEGLSLLNMAALGCPHRPLLTRYVVQCIRTALKTDPSRFAGKDHIFHEVDDLGDNPVIACARAGDRCADVLSEIVRPFENQPPLFRMRHTNADGYTALHVACSKHSAASPRLHTVHVLLVHGGFDIYEGDLKGGDTALHLAVNSPNCDLQLILIMFKQVDRKDWKSLAHYPNLSTKTPIDLARLATKTITRQNYPQEVLEFLKKCR